MTDARRDWAGTEHAPAGSEARIACLVPSLTELLFALRLGERVVAMRRAAAAGARMNGMR